jgi:hypothetical protein
MTRVIATPADASALQDEDLQVEDVADPVHAALAQPSAVLITNAAEGASLIATIRHGSARQAEELAQGRRVIAYTATGFLGLSDEAIYDEAPPEQKKRWWQRRR